jgi:hypothetical protein
MKAAPMKRFPYLKQFLLGGLFGLTAVLMLRPALVASGIATVSSVFGQVGAVNTPITTTDISTPAAPAAGKTISYSKGGKWCAEDPSASETCTGAGGGGPTTNQNVRPPGAHFQGVGGALTGPQTTCETVYISGTISEVVLIADVSGSVTVDVQTVALASYTGPGSASSITAADTPALSSAVKFTDTTLTGWTTSVAANTVFCYVMSSPSTINWVDITLKMAAN